ncbi:MAG: NACHT domain-containing protein [Blastocatellia bacterium]
MEPGTIIALGSFLLNGLNSLKKKDPDSAKKIVSTTLESVAKSYSEHLENRYGKIKILQMEKPIELGKHYTRVNVLHKITARTKDSIELLEKQLKNDGHFGHLKNTKPAIDLITEKDAKTNIYNNIIILGKPGAGKTTFLRYITLQALRGKEGQIKRDVLPIMIELRYLSQSKKTLIEFIEEQFDVCGAPNARPLITSLLEEGKCLVLLDGLDEVSKSRVDDIVNEVRNLVDKYSKNQFILSCRIAAYNYVFEQFCDVEIADFNDGQIENFVLSWFGEDKTKSKTFLEELKKNKSIRELATTPILTALMCIDYNERMSFPTNRAELYKQCIDTLLEKWDGTRSIQREQIYKNLSKSKKELMLARIAEEMFRREKNFLPQNILSQWIGNFIKNIPSIKPEDIELDSEQVIKSIEAQHGILVERAEGIYSFSHLTFQEYFTAKYIVDKNNYQQIIEQHLFDSKWKEVFLLTSGLVGEADELLLAIKTKIDSLLDDEFTYLLRQIFENENLLRGVIDTNKLSDLRMAMPVEVKCISLLTFLNFVIVEIRDIETDTDRPIRAIGVDIFRARAIAIDIGSVMDMDIPGVIVRSIDMDVDIDIARAIVRSIDIDGIAKNIARNIARGLNIDWLINFVDIGCKFLTGKVTQEDLNTLNTAVRKSSLQINKIADYLYGTKLLLECLSSDCYISIETREQIMKGLLTVSNSTQTY